jgi:phosphatidylserine/phosphatidylglycerophosphate/cardiolipin synthase-like enzyme
MGERVSIQGIVTMGNKLQSDLQTGFFIQDSSGGLRVFARYAQQAYQPGDVLRLTGTVHQYRGTTELIPEWRYAWLQSEGGRMPEPVILNCDEINRTFQPDYSEPNEGRLIRLDQAIYDPDHALLADSTGTCRFFIDTETGFEIQGGKIRLTGILIQNKTGPTDPGPPYRNDYCIQPRTEFDIIPLSSLRFFRNPEITEWYKDGVAMSFETTLPCTCRINYRWAEYDSTGISLSRAVEHTVKLSGLQPATIYHYRIICSDGLEEIKHTGSFVTRSSSDVMINVFFNGDTRGTADNQSVTGQQDLYGKFTGCVEAAEHSIDFCFMKLTDTGVTEALSEAFARGVKIRFICEEDEAGSKEIQILKESGIPVLTDCSGVNSGKGIMHHKFAVFDHRDRSSLDDDRVWTGSFNLTDYGQFPRPNENVVLIEDAALAALFTAGFEIMWGSDEESPNPERAVFEAGPFNQLPHQVMTGETLIEVFFSPEGDAGAAVENALRSVEHSLSFCMYSFTRSELANAVIDLAHIQDIDIRGLLDSRQIEADGMYSQWERLSASSEQIRKYLEGPRLHHKYAVIDALYDSSDPMVITGSYNWTSSAEIRNNENVILIHNAMIAELYRQEFEARYHERTQGINISLPLCWRLNPNFPNPFNGKTSVLFELPKPTDVVLSVLDVRGQLVRNLLNQRCGAGDRIVEWDGRNDEGRIVSNGVYLIRLVSSEYSDGIKAVLMK